MLPFPPSKGLRCICLPTCVIALLPGFIVFKVDISNQKLLQSLAAGYHDCPVHSTMFEAEHNAGTMIKSRAQEKPLGRGRGLQFTLKLNGGA